MFYVYLLRSESRRDKRYTGLTADLRARLKKHNEGGVPSTSSFRPWTLETYLAFTTQEQAAAFERYLKTGSGRAFANRHLRADANDKHHHKSDMPAGDTE
ncbi:MAG: GIY-YIG nuclease family protein [Acidobacteria bacterium]|mgnify:FL=1|nr:GIY-YIG nuclease family protein [Acidobacteriota bacterium]